MAKLTIKEAKEYCVEYGITVSNDIRSGGLCEVLIEKGEYQVRIFKFRIEKGNMWRVSGHPMAKTYSKADAIMEAVEDILNEK